LKLKGYVSIGLKNITAERFMMLRFC